MWNDLIWHPVSSRPVVTTFHSCLDMWGILGHSGTLWSNKGLSRSLVWKMRFLGGLIHIVGTPVWPCTYCGDLSHMLCWSTFKGDIKVYILYVVLIRKFWESVIKMINAVIRSFPKKLQHFTIFYSKALQPWLATRDLGQDYQQFWFLRGSRIK